MPRKRIKSKRKRPKRPVIPDLKLLLSFYLGGRDAEIFKTPEDYRQAWEYYRAEILPEFVEQHPGERPAAWWTFDSPEPLDPEVEEWVQLHRLGIMEPEELDFVRRDWLTRLGAMRESLQHVYRYHRQGVTRYFGYVHESWPAACSRLDQEAALLGSDAVEAWERLENNVTGGDEQLPGMP